MLSGLSAGLFTGTATATLVDLAPAHRRSSATRIALVANLGGLSAGTALEEVEMSRDLVAAASLLMDAATLLLEGHERKAWAEMREAREAARAE